MGISTLAVLAALAFWTPYNDGQRLPCSAHDVMVYPTGQPLAEVPANSLGYAPLFGQRTCAIAVSDDLYHRSDADQCRILAHEWGHAWFGLDHSSDPANVMAVDPPVPGACRPSDWWGGRQAAKRPAKRRSSKPTASGRKRPRSR